MWCVAGGNAIALHLRLIKCIHVAIFLVCPIAIWLNRRKRKWEFRRPEKKPFVESWSCIEHW